MATSTHTPGPWIFTQFCKRDGAPIETVDDVAMTIAGSALHSERAELFGVTLDGGGELATVVCYTGNGPNAHNNARVIAAAPDLLAACRALLKYATRRDGTRAPLEDVVLTFVEDDSTLAECIDRAELAVAKADGL